MGLFRDVALCGIGFIAGYYVAKEFDFPFYNEVKRTIKETPETQRRISDLEERVKFYEKLLSDYIDRKDKELERKKENGK